MKQIKEFINEKLVINKDTKISNDTMSPEMKSIWDHFEMDKLYEVDKGRLQKEPFLTKEEGKEMIEKLEDFLSKNKWDASKFKYFILAGHKFKDNKIAKDFKKHNPTIMWKNSDIDYAKDKETLYKKDSLRFDASASKKLLGMYGPYGGSRVVQFDEQ
jgi:hypothetical protein